MAKASATGLCATSEPRMLNSQAIEFGQRQIRRRPGRPCATSPAGRLIFCSAGLPAYFSGCGTTGPCGGAGRALPQTRSTRLRRQRLQLDALALERLGQLFDGAGRMQPGIEADHRRRR